MVPINNFSSISISTRGARESISSPHICFIQVDPPDWAHRGVSSEHVLIWLKFASCVFIEASLVVEIVVFKAATSGQLHRWVLLHIASKGCVFKRSDHPEKCYSPALCVCVWVLTLWSLCYWRFLYYKVLLKFIPPMSEPGRSRAVAHAKGTRITHH